MRRISKYFLILNLLTVVFFTFFYTEVSAQTYRCAWNSLTQTCRTDPSTFNECDPPNTYVGKECWQITTNSGGECSFAVMNCQTSPPPRAYSCGSDGLCQECDPSDKTCTWNSLQDCGNSNLCLIEQPEPCYACGFDAAQGNQKTCLEVSCSSSVYEGLSMCLANCEGAIDPRSPAERIGGECGVGYIDSAIGCIPYIDLMGMIRVAIIFSFSIAGGVGLVLIVISSFQVATSAGDPRKLQSAKELLFATITGLLMLIFAIFLLRVIGIGVLGVLGV